MSIPEDWVQVVSKDQMNVVNEYLPRWSHLDKTTEPGPGPFSRNDRPSVRSRARSRAGSNSEGHISPDEDGPSKKILPYDD